ncbi:ATP-dependent DNA ligase [Spartobacteria bacterium LR76]|nr:ATP-dependent DNA ligase [Spartobacteria bacterium LR76]
MSLKTYHSKRNSQKTPEPWKDLRRAAGRTFVVQKHAASRLHYDFRLELGGVLKSWALPKGLPFRHGEKHLAVHVEDHPRSYGDFEGAIPKGQYGGGTVMLWDRGIYKPLSRSPRKDLEAGKLHVELHGEKLSGEWTLVRMRGKGNEWLIIRSDRDLRPLSARADDRSVKSGCTMKQIEKGDPSRKQAASGEKVEPSAGRKPFPPFIETMKALTVEQPPPGDWFYEIKFDGWRALALCGREQVKIMSRNHRDMTGIFPEIAHAIERLGIGDSILDGEIVALDSQGRSSFQALQAYRLASESPALFYYVFDLPRYNGGDLRGRPVEVRKEMLREIVSDAGEMIRFSDSLGSNYRKLRNQVGALGLEGLIGKRAGSLYESGRRSGAWIKIKIVREQELVIAGYTDPQGSRSGFGAILLGYYKQGKLVSAGKAGTGFSDALLRSLSARFRQMQRGTMPFSDARNLTPAELRSAHWVWPELVAQIRFREWTGDGRLRQPVFLGLREDKAPRDVVREDIG